MKLAKEILGALLHPLTAYIDYARGADVQRQTALGKGLCPLCGEPIRPGENLCDACHLETMSW
jgi:hypothetical protein